MRISHDIEQAAMAAYYKRRRRKAIEGALTASVWVLIGITMGLLLSLKI